MKEMNIKISNIQVDPENANIHTDIDLESRKRSIKSIGLQYPIKVISLGDGLHQIVDGESRYTACKLLDWDTIPCQVLDIDPSNHVEIARYSFALNKERELYPFAECRHISRLYQAKRMNSKKTKAIREEIAKEFGYSEITIGKMVAVGEIPSCPNGQLGTFGINSLKALLPLRVGNMNSKTGENNIDYLLVHKCVEWLYDKKRIPPTVADVSEYKDIVSDEMKGLAVKHQAVLQVQKELKEERDKHEKELEQTKSELEQLLTQSHQVEMEQKSSEIKRLTMRLESKDADADKVHEMIEQLENELSEVHADIDSEIEKRVEIQRRAWEGQKETDFQQRLRIAENTYRETINRMSIVENQQDLAIERLREELEQKDSEIEAKDTLIDRIRKPICLREYVEGVRIHHGPIAEMGIKFDDDSVDLILTDPPYGEEYLDCWTDLAKFAARSLKPGRFLVTYSGQFHFDKVMAILSGELTYYWSLAMLHSGNKQS